MKEQNKTLKNELSKMEIANLSNAEFKTLMMRMFRELIEYNRSIREEMKATLSEIKKNPRGTNSEGKETRVQINDLEHKEEINIQPEQKEKARIQTNEDSIRRLQDISKSANIPIIGISEAEEEKQEIEKLI